MKQPVILPAPLFVANFVKEWNTERNYDGDVWSERKLLQTKRMRGAGLPEGLVDFMNNPV